MSLFQNRPPERLTGRRSNEIPNIGDYLVPQANKGSDVYDADLKHNKTPAYKLIRLQESSAPNKRAIFRVPRKVNSVTHAGLITKIVNEVKEKLRSLGVATALSAIGPEVVVEYSSRIVELLPWEWTTSLRAIR